jgi:hypothetical protein
MEGLCSIIMSAADIGMRACFLLAELESLGLRSIRLNQFSNNNELYDLISVAKRGLLREHW